MEGVTRASCRAGGCAELGDVAALTSERVSPTDYPEAPYIGLEHVEAHTNRVLATVLASTMASSAVSFSAGDVLYGRMRPYLNKVVRPQFSGLRFCRVHRFWGK